MKKILIAILSLVTVFTIAACENPEKPIEEDSPTPPPKTADVAQTPKPEKVISESVDFYFPDEALMYLIPENRTVNVLEGIFLESVVQSIIAGPTNEDLIPAIDGDVEVLSVTLNNGICTVDLSSEFAENNTGGSAKESMAVYSIVNTLCGMDGVDKVKINIEGNDNADFGQFSLVEPLEMNTSILNPDAGDLL